MKDFTIVTSIQSKDLEYIRKWMEADELNGRGAYYDFDDYCKAQENDNLHGIMIDGKIEGVEICSIEDRVAYLENISVNSSFQRKGYGKALQRHWLNVAKERGCLVAVLENVSESGHLLSQSNGFITFEERNEYKKKYLILVNVRPVSTQGRRLGLWKNTTENVSKDPDKTWSIDFEQDSTPIIEPVINDWTIGIIEDDGTVSHHDKAKNLAGYICNMVNFIHLTKDPFVR